MPMERRSIRLKKRQVKLLEEYKDKTGVDISNAIRQGIELFLNENGVEK